ncbi:MAG TPA: hypothetical protein V6C95_24265 [Coleofasciculaceae cyanobacterium]
MENIKPHDDPIIYSARGKICGIYRPNPRNFLQGILLTDDGLKIPAEITSDLATELKANRDLLRVAQVWKCYPRTEPPCVLLVKLKSAAKTAQELKRKGVNTFRIAGQVLSIEDQDIEVLVKRNEFPPNDEEIAFIFTISGEVPEEAVGEFWRFNVRREGWNWTIKTANFVAPTPEVLKEQFDQRKRVLSVRITEKEFRALATYAEMRRSSQTKVVRALIRKLPTYERDS